MFIINSVQWSYECVIFCSPVCVLGIITNENVKQATFALKN